MQLLCVHAESFGFEARNPDPDIETTGTQTAVERCLVVFVAVEPADCARKETTTAEAASVVREVVDQLSTEQLAIVPCRQLTDRPADEPHAVLSTLVAQFDSPVEVPLGWDVAFDIETRAHPFAIQHHRIEPARASGESDWLIFRDGTLVSTETTDETVELLQWECGERSPSEPKYLKTVQEFGLFDTESPGNLQLRPRGVFARNTLSEYVAGVLSEFGALPVEQFDAGGEQSVFAHRSVTADALPLRLFEQRGAGKLLTSEAALPAATVPTLAVLVADLPAAVAEACEQIALVTRLWETLDLSFKPVIRIREEDFQRDSEEITALYEIFDSPVLVERRPVADWLVKVDFVTVAAGEPATTPTLVIEEPADQLEVEGVDSQPVVVQSLPVGAVEQTLGAVLGGDDTQLPLWLAPVQFRLIPIEPADHLEYCEQLAEQFEQEGIRVDIDDRNTAVRERLAAAEGEGVPYYTVVGADELAGETLGVTRRRDGTDHDLSVEELQEQLLKEGIEKPNAGLSLPRYVSEY